MTREPEEAVPDRRTDAVKRPRRFRIRIRDWLVAVVLVALLAAGVAQIVRARRLRVERELAEALRLQEEVIREHEAIRRMTIRFEEEARKLEEMMRQFEATTTSRDGVFPDPDRKGLPDDGRTDL